MLKASLHFSSMQMMALRPFNHKYGVLWSEHF